MAIFNAGPAPGVWIPTQLARGPFAGLQGGAVAGLLCGEIEAMAAARGWGVATSVSAWFLRPVPMAALRTVVSPLRSGGRLSVVDNTLWAVADDEPCAVARVTLATPRPIEIPGFVAPQEASIDPTSCQLAGRRAPHGEPWFMDAMEARADGRIAWFRLKDIVIDGAGSLAQILGPADWAHGIARPVSNVVADPNSNLTVQLVRPPRGDWIGVEPQTHWRPELGAGMGGGLLHDAFGVVGRVAMSVTLTALSGPASNVRRGNGDDPQRS